MKSGVDTADRSFLICGSSYADRVEQLISTDVISIVSFYR